jgi:hypothetical protein
VPYYEAQGAEKVIEGSYGEIFCRELVGWYTDERMWPQSWS